ncbi:MAG: HAMP domain-containing histidine kinase [Myxococcaceae bacterium]|nr:HAMP domain-containing histidine kinase [Myxococcaceae bacterium]
MAFLAPTLALLALGGFLLFRASRNVLERQLGEALSATASTIAAQLSPERVLSVTADDAVGEGSRTWRSLKKTLEVAQAASGARRILVFDAERRARLDVGGGLPPGAEVPELLRDALELEVVFAGQRNASQVLFKGTDGAFYKTGYAPIVQDGRTVAVVAVEGSAAFFGPLADLRNAFIGLAALTLLLLAVAAVLSARQVSRPLEALVRAAQSIGRGDLSSPVSTAAKTVEVSALSRELELMRAGLESRDRQLKMMLGGVAHEVKNPLGGIELFSGLLDEELRSPSPGLAESREHLGRIRRELDYLKRIVEDFLAFAREQKVTRTPFDAKAFVTSAVGHLQGEAAGRGVTLDVDVPALRLEGDESLLTSALVNLVKNALQVSKAGQRVRVVGREERDHGALEVHDEGPGIAADLQARVFEPFFTTREKGTGLGLPLARKLVEANGGTLSLESQPGRTVFRLTVPRAS